MRSNSYKSALRARVSITVAILALVALLVSSVASADPVISGEGTFTYHQGDPAIGIGTGITLAGGSSYGGQFIQFAVDASNINETLSLASVGSPDTTSGAVSVVGSTVYLGNGSSADVIGTIDATDDGAAGRTLRVNFADEFVNPSFEDGLTGWTVSSCRPWVKSAGRPFTRTSLGCSTRSRLNLVSPCSARAVTVVRPVSRWVRGRYRTCMS